MCPFQLRASARAQGRASILRRISLVFAMLLVAAAGPASAQELRYSWLDMSFMNQDVDRAGSQVTPDPNQVTSVDVSDGSGIRFRGSLGTWKNMYLFVDYSSTDIDVSGDVTVINPPLTAPISDEFDYTSIRGGFGVKWSILNKTDLYGEISYDSLDLDFGSFAGENFDTDDADLGGALGIRTLFGDDFELRAYGRYTNVGDADLTTLEFDTDTLYGVGFAWQVIRGFSFVGDYESGEFSSWSVGFRLDLSED